MYDDFRDCTDAVISGVLDGRDKDGLLRAFPPKAGESIASDVFDLVSRLSFFKFSLVRGKLSSDTDRGIRLSRLIG